MVAGDVDSYFFLEVLKNFPFEGFFLGVEVAANIGHNDGEAEVKRIMCHFCLLDYALVSGGFHDQLVLVCDFLVLLDADGIALRALLIHHEYIVN